MPQPIDVEAAQDDDDPLSTDSATQSYDISAIMNVHASTQGKTMLANKKEERINEVMTNDEAMMHDQDRETGATDEDPILIIDE